MDNILSIVSLVVTIIFGIIAMYQAWRYNKDSEKISSDTKYMLVNQIRMLNQIEKKLKSENKSGIIDMSKDTIRFHKLSTFDNKKSEEILNEIKHLKIKSMYINNISNFLKGNKIDYECDFVGLVGTDGIFEIYQLYTKLIKYDIVVEIA